MGRAFPIDALTNVVFGIAMFGIGAVTIAQTAHLARLYRRSIVHDPERGPASSMEMGSLATLPAPENQSHLTRHSAPNEINVQVSRDTLGGPDMESTDESIDSVSVTQQLQGIGTSFADGEAQDESHLVGHIADMDIDTKAVGMKSTPDKHDPGRLGCCR